MFSILYPKKLNIHCSHVIFPLRWLPSAPYDLSKNITYIYILLIFLLGKTSFVRAPASCQVKHGWLPAAAGIG